MSRLGCDNLNRDEQSLGLQDCPSEGKAKACRMCGECCRLDIPVSILDIHNLAKGLGVSPEEVFEKYIEKELTPEGTFYLAKDGDGDCLLLGDDSRCKIYPSRPLVCWFYYCSDEYGLGEVCDPDGKDSDLFQSRLILQTIALNLTRVYSAKNGRLWNLEDYQTCIMKLGDLAGSAL